jgi:oligopeptide/dipeptide ABC transporter ATP-binding protein
MTEAPILSVRNLRKHFAVSGGLLSRRSGVVHAVEDVSFDLPRGQVLGLVGESGSGKTTVGRLVLRLLEPTDGSIVFEGTDITRATGRAMREVRRGIQIVFQDPFGSLNPRMTVRRIVGEGLYLHGLARGKAREERIRDLLARVGLSPGFADRYPHEFSGGQRQRIGIARALAVEPRLLIADEPVSALDVSIQAQVLNLLQDLKDEFRLSMVIISHDLGVVHHVADHVAVMYLGRVMEIGPAEALYDDPCHPYTEALLGSMPLPDPEGRDSRRGVVLKGDIPSPINPPSGCVFRTRCPIAAEECARVVPPLETVGPGHQKACIRR